MKNSIWIFLVIALAFFAFLSCKNEQKKGDLLIENVNVIDVKTGQINTGKDVLISGDSIANIDENGEFKYLATETIDGSGKYLIPGLWDMHVHIQDSSYLKMFLDFGVVGVRDMGGCVKFPTDGCESLCPDILSDWKEKIGKDQLEGPNLYISGRVLSGTGWTTSLKATSVKEVQNNFKTILDSQVDFVKVYEKIPADAYREIARLCQIHNLDFAGHVSDSLLLSEISDLGQKSVEHLREPILYCFTNDPKELEAFMVEDSYTQEDRNFVKPWIDDSEKVIEAFKRNKTWFVPTMAVQFARQRYDDSIWINHPLRKKLPNSVNDGFTQHLKTRKENPDKKGDSLWWMAHKKLVKRFNDEGIGLLAGSDISCEGGIPGFTLHEELRHLVDSGLSPLQALQTATINPAKYFDLKSTGQIKENFKADLVLLGKNPLKSIKNTLSINKVLKNGKVQQIFK